VIINKRYRSPTVKELIFSRDFMALKYRTQDAAYLYTLRKREISSKDVIGVFDTINYERVVAYRRQKHIVLDFGDTGGGPGPNYDFKELEKALRHYHHLTDDGELIVEHTCWLD
jgi:hypothetical protein